LDAVEGVEVSLVGFGRGVEVLLGGLEVSMPQSVHDRGEVGSSGEQPGGVGVAEVVHATGKSTPLARTAGIQTRVRKVREIGVPAVVVNSCWSRPMLWILMWGAAASSQSSSTPKVRGSLSLG